MSLFRTAFLTFLPLMLLAAAFANPLAAEDFKQKNTAENLKAFFEKLHAEIHKEKDLEAAQAQFVGLIPDEARLNVALKDDISPEIRTAILEFHKKLGTPPAETMPRMMKAEQTNIFVHGATTEEIIAYKEDSVAYKEFPGGTRDVAAKALKPKMTFYEVEFIEPGEEFGMKHHLFYWDGKRWTILGPVWRAMR